MKNLTNALNESLNESKLDISEKPYNLPLAAVLSNQTGLTGVLIGGTFTSNDNATRTKAEALIKKLGYNIVTSFDDYMEVAKESHSFRNDKNVLYGYAALNDETDVHCSAIGLDDLYVLNSI